MISQVVGVRIPFGPDGDLLEQLIPYIFSAGQIISDDENFREPITIPGTPYTVQSYGFDEPPAFIQLQVTRMDYSPTEVIPPNENALKRFWNFLDRSGIGRKLEDLGYPARISTYLVSSDN